VSGCKQILQDVNIIHEKETKDFKHRVATLGVKDGDVVSFNAILLSIEHVQELGFLAAITQWLPHVSKLWEIANRNTSGWNITFIQPYGLFRILRNLPSKKGNMLTCHQSRKYLTNKYWRQQNSWTM
jgi:hypothetical protein